MTYPRRARCVDAEVRVACLVAGPHRAVSANERCGARVEALRSRDSARRQRSRRVRVDGREVRASRIARCIMGAIFVYRAGHGIFRSPHDGFPSCHDESPENPASRTYNSMQRTHKARRSAWRRSTSPYVWKGRWGRCSESLLGARRQYHPGDQHVSQAGSEGAGIPSRSPPGRPWAIEPRAWKEQSRLTASTVASWNPFAPKRLRLCKQNSCAIIEN